MPKARVVCLLVASILLVGTAVLALQNPVLPSTETEGSAIPTPECEATPSTSEPALATDLVTEVGFDSSIPLSSTCEYECRLDSYECELENRPREECIDEYFECLAGC